eukprot:1164344-Pyramimonas_sp.AAC.1
MIVFYQVPKGEKGLRPHRRAVPWGLRAGRAAEADSPPFFPPPGPRSISPPPRAGVAPADAPAAAPAAALAADPRPRPHPEQQAGPRRP